MEQRKLIIITVKITLPNGYKPRTVTCRTFSIVRHGKEVKHVCKSAKELFVKSMLEGGAEFGLTENQVATTVSVISYNVHGYISQDIKSVTKYE